MTGHIDPEREAFEAFKALPRDDGPIHMLNLIRLRPRAAYADGREATGAQAYKTYGEESAPVFRRVGGRIVQSWDPQVTLIGPAREVWHIAFIAEYPAAAAFLEMVTDPAYQAAVHHRQAAAADSRLIRLKPRAGRDAFG